MKQVIIIAIFLFTILSFSQEYKFKAVVDIETSNIKSQGNTGTCWSFSASSFIESELFRINGEFVDISEMFTVRNTYDDKAWNYVMRQGKIQFSQGGLGHDVINSIHDNGIVPEVVFSGLFKQKIYNHKEIVPSIKNILDSYIKHESNSEFADWKKAVSEVLDEEIGKVPAEFSYKNKKYTPKSFAKSLNFNANNYITLTSFSHQPFYTNFVLNIPDNFSNGSMYNVSLDELVTVVDKALKNGYSIELDVDVSEKTFSSKFGIAIIPNNSSDNEKGLIEIVPEKQISQEYRQQEFENYNTTDDHLMHIVGLLKDQNGNLYYKVKNSWGTNSKRIGNDGYIYMSVAYFRLKTISVLLHKDGISKSLLKKLNVL